MIDNITIDTGKCISTFYLGESIVFTNRLNEKRYEKIKQIKIVDNNDCLIVTDFGNYRYYINDKIISYEIINVGKI